MDKKHKKHKLTYFITGGGTGGHIYPALAIFEELLKKDTTKDIYYIGNRKNLEYGIIRSKNYKFLDVDVEGMPRKADPHFFMWGVKLFLAVIKSCFYILKYRPDAIFGTGGYVSAPTVMAGWLLRVPYVLHDCDAKPGLVTRKLAPKAKIFLCWIFSALFLFDLIRSILAPNMGFGITA